MYSPQTLRAYTTDIRLFTEYLAGGERGADGAAEGERGAEYETLENTSKKTARAYVMTLLEQKKSARTTNRTISSLRGLFHYLIQQGVVKTNPFATIKNIKQGERLPRFIPQTDMDTIVHQLKNTALSSHSINQTTHSTVVLLLYFTGLRRAEICSLRLCDIDAEQITVTGKGGKQRIVPLNTEIQEIMDNYLRKRAEFFCNSTENSLFLVKQKQGNTHRKLTPNDIYTITKLLLGTNPHTLRHTFATHLLQNQVGIRSIQELLGHSSIESTQVYSHNTIESLKESFQKAHPRAAAQNNNQYKP